MSNQKTLNSIRKTKEEITRIENAIKNNNYYSSEDLLELQEELSDLKFELIEFESEGG